MTQLAHLNNLLLSLGLNTGKPVTLLGTVTVQVKYGEQLLQLPVHVVDGDGSNLLGISWESI